MSSDDEDNLRYILERQKEDSREMKKQSRNYILGVGSTAVLLIGVIYRFDIQLIVSTENTASRLSEIGLLWQLGLLTSSHAYALIEALQLIPGMLISFGIALLFISVRSVYQIEKAPGCQPIGNAGIIQESKPWVIREWIEKNDKLLELFEDIRMMATDLAQIGVILIFSGILMMVFLNRLIIIFFIILFATIFWVFTVIHSRWYIKDTSLQKGTGALLILIIGTAPLSYYQTLTNYNASGIYVNLYFAAVVCLMILYYFFGHDAWESVVDSSAYDGRLIYMNKQG